MRNLAYLIVLTVFLISVNTHAQKIEPEYKLVNSNIEGIIKTLDSYRFGMVNIWQLNDVSQKIEDMIKPYLGSQQQAKVDSSIIPRFKEKYSEECYSDVYKELIQGTQPATILGRLQDCFPDILELDSLSLIIAPPMDFGGIKSAYIITTKNKNEKIKGEIIALVVSKESLDPTSDLTMATDEKLIFTFIEQKAIKDPQDETISLYSLMQNYLDQDNVQPVTAEIQGQGEKWYAPWGPGHTKTLFKDEKNIDANRDVQTLLRISEAQPFKYFIKNNELIVGPDLISWKQYPYDAATFQPDQAVNDSLPKYGAELRYGIDAINYPSFWSERWTLSALWKNVKMGIILPSSGWAGSFNDMFSLQRRFTTAGPGIAANFDFPFPVIQASGVFNFNFGYVSGDAEVSPFKTRRPFVNTPIDSFPDYLIRGHAKIQYTFGVSIDDNYLLRLGLGGTVYNVETWYDKIVNKVEDGQVVTKREYSVLKNETIGGISTKIEFMAINNSTPFGASLQYFDETIKANVWLQIPVIYNTFFIRIDADTFSSLRKQKKDDNLRPWEANNNFVFIPMVKGIFIF
jgi:hypothetical protein